MNQNHFESIDTSKAIYGLYFKTQTDLLLEIKLLYLILIDCIKRNPLIHVSWISDSPISLSFESNIESRILNHRDISNGKNMCRSKLGQTVILIGDVEKVIVRCINDNKGKRRW